MAQDSVLLRPSMVGALIAGYKPREAPSLAMHIGTAIEPTLLDLLPLEIEQRQVYAHGLFETVPFHGTADAVTVDAIVEVKTTWNPRFNLLPAAAQATIYAALLRKSKILVAVLDMRRPRLRLLHVHAAPLHEPLAELCRVAFQETARLKETLAPAEPTQQQLVEHLARECVMEIETVRRVSLAFGEIARISKTEDQ